MRIPCSALVIAAAALMPVAAAFANEPVAGPAVAAAPVEAGAKTSLFVIVYRAGPNWNPELPMEKQGLLEHFYYMRDLYRRGVVRLAGPFGGDGGIVVLAAADQAAAQAVVDGDPATTAGLFIGEVRPFSPRFVSSEPFVAQ